MKLVGIVGHFGFGISIYSSESFYYTDACRYGTNLLYLRIVN